MRALVDTNVIIDVLERRETFFEESYAVLKRAAQGKLEALAPAGSIADVYYIIHKSGKSDSQSRDAIAALLQLVTVCDTAATDVTTALTLGVTDFEDAILAASAKREKADYIITRNGRDFKHSPVPAISPADFLQHG